MRWDTSVGRTSSGSLRIDVDDVNRGPAMFLNWTEGYTPGELYRIALYARPTALDDSAVVGLEIRWQDNATGSRVPGDPRPGFFLHADATSGKWHQLAGVVRAPESKTPGGALKMQVLLYTSGGEKGAVYFDDLTITHLDKATVDFGRPAP